MALNFAGTPDRVNHGNIAGMDSATLCTLMAWVQIPDLAVVYAILSRASGVTPTDNYSPELYINTDGSWHVLITRAADGHSAASALVANTWTHLTLAYDGTQATNALKLRMYRNGVDESAAYTGTIPAALPAIATPLYAMFRNADAGPYGKGKIAIVKMWLASLTAAEIAQEVNSFHPVRTTNLKLWSPYDDTNARDYSGAGNHGTTTGTTVTQGPPVDYGAMVNVI